MQRSYRLQYSVKFPHPFNNLKKRIAFIRKCVPGYNYYNTGKYFQYLRSNSFNQNIIILDKNTFDGEIKLNLMYEKISPITFNRDDIVDGWVSDIFVDIPTLLVPEQNL